MLVDRGKNDEVMVGHVSDLAVQPVDYVEAGHAMSGDEALILRLASPSGAPIFVPLEVRWPSNAGPSANVLCVHVAA